MTNSRDDPEVVLRQALRAMAGGRREEQDRRGGDPRRPGVHRPRLTVTQILLIAAIIGVLLGMAGAFAVLMTR